MASSSSSIPAVWGNSNDRRQAKIERFKAEREIKAKLEQIEAKRRATGAPRNVSFGPPFSHVVLPPLTWTSLHVPQGQSYVHPSIDQ